MTDVEMHTDLTFPQELLCILSRSIKVLTVTVKLMGTSWLDDTSDMGKNCHHFIAICIAFNSVHNAIKLSHQV